MINKRRLVNTFIKLVKIDSLSLREKKAVSYLKSELNKLGLKSYYAGKVEGGNAQNLVVDIPGRGPRVLLNAHVDTVSPGIGIRPVKKNGFIIPGGQTVLGADNKAGVAAILEIIRLIQAKKISHPTLRVLFTVAEEIGLLGAVAMPRKLLSARYGIVLDGGDINEILNRAPTQYSLSATVFGRAAHAGIHPEQGVNAIQAASRAIAKMRLGRIDAETTANIGVIKGGRATNIIPDKVELKGEARSHNLDKLRRQVDQMEGVLVRTCAKFGAKARVEIRQAYTAFEINENSTLVKLAAAAIKSLGIKPVIKKTGGGSDANIFNAAGVQTIIMGVGADQVHTLSERLAIADLIKGTEIIVQLLEGLSREKTY